jgi:predicted nucleic acid-binding Zn ribbon protein
VSEASFPIEDGPSPAIVCECGLEAYRVFEAIPAQFKGTGWGSKP